MTEQEWLASDDPLALLSFLIQLKNREPHRHLVSNRKLRLFAIACCRKVQHLMKDERSLRAIDLLEQFVDEDMAEDFARMNDPPWLAFRSASKGCQDAAQHATRFPILPASAADCAALAAAYATRVWATHIYEAAASALAAWHRFHNADDGLARERLLLCANLRDIVGNPFRPYPVITQLSSTVLQLANALYNGQDCAFALHDALLDAGQSAELADHFRREQYHPKGCWVVDLLLGKE